MLNLMQLKNLEFNNVDMRYFYTLEMEEGDVIYERNKCI